MTTIVTRAGKGSALTNSEMDSNTVNLKATADAALPKAGGAMTGAITTNSTFDGVDIATRDAVLTSTTTTANAALPKAGGTLTGNLSLGDNVKLQLGNQTNGDLQIYHDGSHSYIKEVGAGDLLIYGTNLHLRDASGYDFINCTDTGTGGTVTLFNLGSAKLATTSTGIDVTGLVAADSLTVDNFTLDGTTLALSSGDMTLDAAGDIILDADGADVILKDGGTSFLEIDKDGDNARLKNPIADGDIKIQGIDGASTITMVSFDASSAGAATFSAGVFAGAPSFFPAISINNNSYLGSANNTTAIQIATSGATTFSHTITANAGVVVDNITIDGSEIDCSSGNLVLDGASNITFDADGGQVEFKDAGALKAMIDFTGNNVEIQSRVADGDLLFRGLDGSSFITALQLDMSLAGLATFNNGIKANRDIAAFGANTGSSANRMALSMEGSGVSRLICNGADASTVGTFEVFTAVSGGTGSVKLGIDAAGAATFASTIAATSATFTPSSGETVVLSRDGAGPYFGTNGNKTLRIIGNNTTAIAISTSAEVTMPNQPAFYATPSSQQSNIAANDSAITIGMGTEIFDVGGNFASSAFTAPVTGKYQLNVSIYLTNVDTAASYVLVGIITSNRNYINIVAPKYASDPAYLTQNISTLADMDANDTAYLFYQQSGGAAQTDVQDDTRASFFQGYLVA